MIPSREQTQALMDARSAAARAIDPAGAFTIADQFERIVDRFGDRPFLVQGSERLSYAEVEARANRVAHALLGLGLARGDCVAIALDNRPDFFSAWFGAAKAGIVPAFLNTNISGRPLAHALAITGARAAIVGDEVLERFRGLEAHGCALPLWRWPDPERPPAAELLALCALDLSARAASAGAARLPASARAGIRALDNAMFVFTSGTTGLPKAALNSHWRWLSAGEQMRVTVGAGCEDVF